MSQISGIYSRPPPHLVSIVDTYRNTIVQGDDAIAGAEVRQLIANFKGLKYQCFSENLSPECIESIVANDLADKPAAA